MHNLKTIAFGIVVGLVAFAIFHIVFGLVIQIPWLFLL